MRVVSPTVSPNLTVVRRVYVLRSTTVSTWPVLGSRADFSQYLVCWGQLWAAACYDTGSREIVVLCNKICCDIRPDLFCSSFRSPDCLLNRKHTQGKVMATSRVLALRPFTFTRAFFSLNTIRQLSASKVLSSKPFYSITYETAGEKFKVQVTADSGGLTNVN